MSGEMGFGLQDEDEKLCVYACKFRHSRSDIVLVNSREVHSLRYKNFIPKERTEKNALGI